MKEYSRIYEYMIKFLNIQIYVYARTNDEQSASAPLHYNTRKITLYLVCSLFFSHEALQNVEKTTAIHLV